MEIKVCRSTEWSEREWKTYVLGFNEVFGTSDSIEFFKDKYLSVHKGYALHSLLLGDDGEVGGGITVIPCVYTCGDAEFLNGLAVDVFIRESYRVDPLMLRRMYKKLRTLLEAEGVRAVTAVPNATAYPYWKNVVKWKDVGDVNYWAVPVRAGNVLGRCRAVLNVCSIVYAYCAYALSALTCLLSGKQKAYKYAISMDDKYVCHKFKSGQYVVQEEGGSRIVYRIVDEDGVKAAYVIAATQDGLRSASVFRKAVGIILKQKVDIIIYVGKMGIFQTLFVKVPKKFEPKELPLMFDVITPDESFSDAYNINDWDFGLLNYDVR